jgi:outer membrane protein assembly factor BamB
MDGHMTRLFVVGTSIVTLAAATPCMSAFTGYGVTPPYGQASWPTLHHDSRNTNASPFVAPTALQPKWTALRGAAVLTAPTIGPEGNVYVATGVGDGSPNLHAFDRRGRLLWESKPKEVDTCALGSSPIIDRDGNVYVSDCDQLWSYRANGRRRWVVPIPQPFITAFFTNDGHVGGVTTDGKVVVVERKRGKSAAPILELPGGPGPAAKLVPPFLWSGMMDPKLISFGWSAIFGYALEVTNTPSVSPVTGRIYINGGGPTPETSYLYGIDFTPGSLSLAFSTLLGPPGGSSPSIAPDDSQVYTTDSNGVLYGIDARDGRVIWQAPDAKNPGAPGVLPDGTVLVGANDRLTAYHQNGTVKWTRSYNYLAEAELGVGSDIKPTTYVTSVVNSDGAGRLFWTATFGYEITPIEGGPVFPPAQRNVLLIVDAADGTPVVPPYPLEDSSELTLGSDGAIYVRHNSVLSSICFGLINAFLPEAAQCAAPLGGIMALEPVSSVDLAMEGIRKVQALGAALAASPTGDVATAPAAAQVETAAIQLDATAAVVRDAAARRQLSKKSAKALTRLLAKAAKSLRSAARARNAATLGARVQKAGELLNHATPML